MGMVMILVAVMGGLWWNSMMEAYVHQWNQDSFQYYIPYVIFGFIGLIGLFSVLRGEQR